MTDPTAGATFRGEDPHAEALAALDRIDAAIGGASVTDARLDPGQLCEQYRRIRPWLETVLPMIQAIPVVGPKIVRVVRMLMSIADTLCPQVA